LARCIAVVTVACRIGWAQQPEQQQSVTEPADHQVIRQRVISYVETFNSQDAAAVGAYWMDDGVSIAAETGERTAGRAALQEEFAAFFRENPGSRLMGEVSSIRMIRPEVALVEGRTTLFVADPEPVESAFTAVLVKEGDQWLISSSHEHDLPAPPTPYDALKELEWMVGVWEDQSEVANVTTTVRWSPRRAFLIRSFSAQFGEDEVLEGTQVIGWDPQSKQIRTWIFNSDGSFGQGTVAKHDDEWMLKMWQILSDGRLAAATKVMTRVDDDTFTVQTIGETVDGEPAPASEPVTVRRTAEAPAVSQTYAPQSDESKEGDTP
jgi:uncharacterized protein (TIGR02246 family)